ncbi:MAG: O-antigen ligase family protein [Dehalococcoidia bacterium]
MQLVGNPPLARASRAVGSRVGRRVARPMEWNAPASLLMAGLLFEIPLAHLPISKALRFLVLGVPQQGDTSARLTPGVFFAPEFLGVVGIGVLMLAGGYVGSARQARAFWVLVTASVLVMVGWAIALGASEFPVLSVTDGVYLIAGLLLGLLILSSRPSPTATRLWVLSLLVGVGVAGAIGTYAYLTSVGLPTDLSQFGRARALAEFDAYQRATYGHPGGTSIVMSTAAVTSLMLFTARGTHPLVRLVLALVFAICAANLLFAFSRWGWASTVVGVSAVVLYWRTSLRGASIVLLLLVAMWFVGARIVDQLAPYFESALDDRSTSNLDLRFGLWLEGVRAVVLNPAGYGAQMTTRAPGLTADSAHNVFLDMSIQNGVLAGLGVLIWSAFHTSWFVRLLRTPRPQHDFAYALTLGTTVFVANQVFNGMYLIGASGMVWHALWFTLPALALVSLDEGDE